MVERITFPRAFVIAHRSARTTSRQLGNGMNTNEIGKHSLDDARLITTHDTPQVR